MGGGGAHGTGVPEPAVGGWSLALLGTPDRWWGHFSVVLRVPGAESVRCAIHCSLQG